MDSPQQSSHAKNKSVPESNELLLDVDSVQAGDVMLTYGNSMVSKGIVLASGGPFSHAAVWIPAMSSDLMGDYLVLAEADRLGVGPTPMIPVTLNNFSLRSVRSAYTIKGSAGSAKLLRHPHIDTVSREKLLAATEALQKSHFYKAYSNLSRLVDAVEVPEKLRPAAKNLKRFVALITVSPESTGAFCSELVALFYAELGLPLFSEAKNAVNVSPNHLNSDFSLLVEVECAFLNPADFDTWRIDRIDNGWDRKTILPITVKARQQSEAVTLQATEFSEWVGTFVDKNVETMACLQKDLEQRLDDAALQFQEMGDIGAVARNRTLSCRLHRLSHLIGAIISQHNSVKKNSSHLTDEQRDSWLTACSELLKQYAVIRGDLLNTHIRQHMLFSMRLLRMAEHLESSIFRRIKLRSNRKSLAKKWRTYVADRSTTTMAEQRFFHSTDLDPLAINYVETTLEAAANAVLQDS